MINDDLLRYSWRDKKFCVLDCETNMLNLFFARPFNIGIQVYQNNNLIENHDLYLKWDNYKISNEVATKTHYNKEKIEKEGIFPKDALNILKSYLDSKDYLFVGNNLLNYDCMVFKNSAAEIGININYKWLNSMYDCNAIFKGFKLGIKPNHENFLAWQFSMNAWKQKGLKSKLGYACKEFKIEYLEEQSHGAIYDCSRSYLLFMELIKKMEIK